MVLDQGCHAGIKIGFCTGGDHCIATINQIKFITTETIILKGITERIFASIKNLEHCRDLIFFSKADQFSGSLRVKIKIAELASIGERGTRQKNLQIAATDN